MRRYTDGLAKRLETCMTRRKVKDLCSLRKCRRTETCNELNGLLRKGVTRDRGSRRGWGSSV